MGGARTTTTEVAGGGLRLEFDRAVLLIESGPEEGREVFLEDRPLVVGRGEDADLRIEDPALSRRHAILRPKDLGWEICDLGSKGGTFLGDTRIEVAPIPQGGRIRVGVSMLVLSSARTELQITPKEDDQWEGLVGRSLPMRRLFATVEKVAPLGLPVLYRGESGTGKEALARATHRLGREPQGPYEVVDCTLLNPEHLRSELFGHTRGAFTGADAARKGAFERADGGTVFLDEVGELPIEIQPTLLRALEQGEVRPLGANGAITVRTRVVSATNRDLAAMCDEGTFREDLYYRLAALVVEVPPLRERGDDVRLLSERFLAPGYTLSADAEAALCAHAWPGNVRQLRNALARACALATGSVVGADDLGLSAGPGREAQAQQVPSPVPAVSPAGRRDELEAELIRETLEGCGGNRQAAAEKLGISRTTLWRRMRRLGLDA